MSTRFDYIEYDEDSKLHQKSIKAQVELLEAELRELVVIAPEVATKDYMANAIRSLEEFYMWTGKIIRNVQAFRGDAQPQEGRTNS